MELLLISAVVFVISLLIFWRARPEQKVRLVVFAFVGFAALAVMVSRIIGMLFFDSIWNNYAVVEEAVPAWRQTVVWVGAGLAVAGMIFFAARQDMKKNPPLQAQELRQKKEEKKASNRDLKLKGFGWQKRIIFGVIFVSVATLWLKPELFKEKPLPTISHKELMERVDAGEVHSVAIYPNVNNEGNRRVVVQTNRIQKDGRFLFAFGILDVEAGGLQAELKAKGIEPEIVIPSKPNWFFSFLSQWGMTFFFIVVFLYIMMQARGGISGNSPLNFTKSRARQEESKTTFADVAGEEEPKEELQEVIEFLKHPSKFQKLHAKIPRGLLLVGPTGCGKTLLAKAVAGEAGVPFFSLSGSEFVEVFVGVGAGRVRDLFEQAKKSAPCIVFIDEIDAVGRHRGAGLGGGNDEREQTLNQLLVAMDGFEANTGIIVIAATNRPDILDPALLRPGRFDRRIIVDNPDSKGRKAILQVHLREIPLASDVNVDMLAKQTPGFSGADLASVVNEGALLAARRDKDSVDMHDFNEAIERVIGGPMRRSRVLTPKEREMVAYHEAGHAILRKLLPHADPPQKVTILSRGMALGYVMGAPPEDRSMRTKSELLDELCVTMGGRVAEELIFGEITTGASNDFEQATGMARKMVTNFGMSDKLGIVTLDKAQGPIFLGRDMIEGRNYSEETAHQIDQEIRRITDEAYERARQTIADNRDKLVQLAQALLERETLLEGDIDEIMNAANSAS